MGFERDDVTRRTSKTTRTIEQRMQWLREARLLTEWRADIVVVLLYRRVLPRRRFLLLHPSEVWDVARPAGRRGLVAGGRAGGVRRA